MDTTKIDSPMKKGLSKHRIAIGMSTTELCEGIVRVAFIGSYLPRKCGIATFTHDLRNSVADRYPEIRCGVVAMNDNKDGYNYDAEQVRFEMDEQDVAGYLRAADFINNSKVSVVSLQHEYGIYGGSCGSHILQFLKTLRVPIVTTLHTILENPNPDQRRILKQILAISTRVVTMADKGSELLKRVYNAPMDKIDIIHHGIPDMEFPDPATYKAQTQLSGKKVILTFGLLGPNKGIEFAIRAMKPVVDAYPDAVYVVLGQTHPGIIRDHGEQYRYSLQHLAEELGIRDNIIFHDVFVDLPLLKKYIASCDVYLTPYLHEAQITSGALSYAFGMGTVVVSTPYWHAAELLAEGRGILIPFRDSDAMANELITLLGNDERRQLLKQQAYEHGRTMTWPRTSEKYMAAFESAQQTVIDGGSQPTYAVHTYRTTLPEMNLRHLSRLTDDTGIMKHAFFAIPDRRHGYATHDVASALNLLSQMRRVGLQETPEIKRMRTVYQSFLHHALVEDSGLFRARMSFDRQWISSVDEDNDRELWAHCLMALGAQIRYGQHRDWAIALFDLGIGKVELESFIARVGDSPRAISYMLLGLRDYCVSLGQPKELVVAQQTLLEKLLAHFRHNATDDWVWFTDTVQLDAPSIPRAVIATGTELQNDEAIDIGERALTWLYERQLLGDTFCPLGNSSVLTKANPTDRPIYDQQPVQTASMVVACTTAYRCTGKPQFRHYGRHAFDWFMGRNLLGKPMYDSATAGCCDALHATGLNQNQGAGSITAMLLSLVYLAADEREVEYSRSPKMSGQDQSAEFD